MLKIIRNYLYSIIGGIIRRTILSLDFFIEEFCKTYTKIRVIEIRIFLRDLIALIKSH